MSFRAYDILASLVPGFLFLLALGVAFEFKYEKDHIIAYTAVAFLFGYYLSTISSWLEPLLYLSWGGKPSSRMLDGKTCWLVPFYESSKVKGILADKASNPAPSSDELFGIAMRTVNGIKDTRVGDFNSSYAFSRVIFTTLLFATLFLLAQNYDDWRYYAVLIPASLIAWLRSKQQAYYYVREVLNESIKFEESKPTSSQSP